MFRHPHLLLLLLLQLLWGHAVSRLNGEEALNQEEYVRVLVGFHNRQEEEQYVRKQQRQQRSAGGKPKTKILNEFKNTEAVTLEVTQAELEQMKTDNTFSYIEEDLEVPEAEHERILQNNGNYEFVSYGIEMTQAHRTFTTDTTWDQECGVYLCVVDSGVNLDHRDIPYSRGDGYVDGKSFGAAEGQDWSNPTGSGHGTQAAGIMIAKGRNRRGIMGVIPQGPERSNVCLRVAKVVPDRQTTTRVSTLLEGTEWCAEQANGKPLVINLSFAVTAQTATERAVYQSLYDQGILLVASAGNFGNSRQTYPASHDSVISVGSVNEDMERSSFSVFNNDVELAAPGENIVILQGEKSEVAMISGTSFASPFVAGLAARIWTGVPRCTNIQVRQAMRDTARRLGEGFPNPEYGYGLIQARSARDLLVKWNCNVDTPSPTPTPTHSMSPSSTPTRILSEDELLEFNLRRFKDVLQSRGPSFAYFYDDIRISAQDWLIEDPQFHTYSDDRLIQRWVLTIFANGFQQASSPSALQNWTQYTHECNWLDSGTEELCNGDDLYVQLDLRQQNLIGTLPSELALLSSHLRTIHMFGNRIYGNLPSELGLLTNLERLELTQNSFSDVLPPEIGNLSRLSFLGLGRNSFWGPLPSELGRLRNIDALSLEWNMFQSEIPSEIGEIRNLSVLLMDHNFLAGAIPQSFGQFSNLEYMNLIHNSDLFGSIPGNLCQLNNTRPYLRVDCQNIECPCCTLCGM